MRTSDSRWRLRRLTDVTYPEGYWGGGLHFGEAKICEANWRSEILFTSYVRFANAILSQPAADSSFQKEPIPSVGPAEAGLCPVYAFFAILRQAREVARK